MDTVNAISLFFIKRFLGLCIHAEWYRKGWNYKDVLEGRTFLWEKVGNKEYEVWLGRFHAYISTKRL